MKRFLTILFAGLLIAAVAAPALAWEFNMKGEYEFRLKYFARTGNSDLFGIATVQAPFVGFAGPDRFGRGATVPVFANTGAGETITRGGFSRWGSDAHYSDSRLTFYPEIRVNPAIRVHGVYTVGGYRNNNAQFSPNIGIPPFERFYQSQTSNNAYDTAAIGSWEQFRATVQLPIGVFSYGVKDFPFGTGATLGNNSRAEAFLTVVPYGPFRILHGVWLSRGLLDGYNQAPDADLKWTWFQGALMTYDNADLSLGIGWFGRTGHFNRAQVNPNGLAPGQAGALFAGDAQDANHQFYVGYFKYNNGRFFMNAEYAWANLDTYFIGREARYLELQHAFGELGVMAGPSRVTVMSAWSPGQNLNGNVVEINRPGGAAIFPAGTFNTTKSSPWAINYQALDPYNTLMFQTYAGGNNTFNGVFVADGNYGMMSDAWCLAGRLDYAVASNLNVWGTYIWAERLERDGVLAGQFFSAGAGLVTNPLVTPDAAAGLDFRDNFGGTNPFAGNGFLGWEANLGVDWKLLEGMTMYVKYAYWQPGEWFDWSYRAIVSGTQAGAAATAITAPVGKDSIQSIQGSFLINF